MKKTFIEKDVEEGEKRAVIKKEREKKRLRRAGKEWRDQVDGTRLRLRAFGPPFPLYICRTCATTSEETRILRPAATTGVRPYVKAGVLSSRTTRSLSLLGLACSHFARTFRLFVLLRFFNRSSTAIATSIRTRGSRRSRRRPRRRRALVESRSTTDNSVSARYPPAPEFERISTLR